MDPPNMNGNGARPPSADPQPQKRTLSLGELAEYLNCSGATIYKYLKMGWLPPRIKKFGQKRFDLDEVNEWLKRDPPAGR